MLLAAKDVPSSVRAFKHRLITRTLAGDATRSFCINFPEQIPQLVDGGARLYDLRSGGVEEPAFGDIHVHFLRVPCDLRCVFTPVDVQRGDSLRRSSTSTRCPAAEGGRALDFNLGQAYMPMDSS